MTAATTVDPDLLLERLIKNIQDSHYLSDCMRDALLLYLLNKEKERQKTQQEHDRTIATLYKGV